MHVSERRDMGCSPQAFGLLHKIPCLRGAGPRIRVYVGYTEIVAPENRRSASHNGGDGTGRSRCVHYSLVGVRRVTR